MAAKAFAADFHPKLQSWTKSLEANKPVNDFAKQADEAHAKTMSRFDTLVSMASTKCDTERAQLTKSMLEVIRYYYLVQTVRLEKGMFEGLKKQMMKKNSARKEADITKFLDTQLPKLQKDFLALEPELLKGAGQEQMEQVGKHLTELANQV